TGRAEGAILTDRGGKGSPKGVLVYSPMEVISLGGSRYTASASLSALNGLLKDGEPQRVVVVGLPCQMRAVSLMERRSEIRSGQVFKIGLFCTWAMEYREMTKLLEKEGVLETPIRFDIPPPPQNIFLVEGQSGRWEIPLDKMRVAIQKGCAFCPDMTGSYADISVGAAEGIKGHNTVCVRDTRGFELLEELTQKGILKVEALPEANLSHLKTAVKNKRERATTKLKERVSHGDIWERIGQFKGALARQ
ncbi:MAG: Coenzyme F420 hydrogenase/dehydrogenase, beta subunit C-terminal domain, partial [Desulfatiglandales bacterium]